ncbi:MAG: MATE family efflux transporter [Anaeroplasmataceae bacterium]
MSNKYNYKSVLLFALPAILVSLITALYIVVDGVFASRFLGTDALSSINIAYPLYGVIIGISIMFAAGGSAIVGKSYGEGDITTARKSFSMFVVTGLILCGIICALFIAFCEPILRLLGSNDYLLPNAKKYATYLLIFAPFASFQIGMAYYLILNGKNKLSLFLTILGGIINLILDFIFLKYTNLGIISCSVATGIGIIIPSFIGLSYFMFSKKLDIKFSKFKFNFKRIWACMVNGSSEMVTHLSNSIIIVFFNYIMLKFSNEDGVAAITIILYVQFLINSIIQGYSVGVSQMFSFNYGAKNKKNIRKLFKISIVYVGVFSVIIFLASYYLVPQLALIFTTKDTNVYSLVKLASLFIVPSFLFSGFSIFISSLFTSFSNGKISAILSLFRSLVFYIIALSILPIFFEEKGAFSSITFAEVCSFALSMFVLIKYCHYIKKDKPNDLSLELL